MLIILSIPFASTDDDDGCWNLHTIHTIRRIPSPPHGRHRSTANVKLVDLDLFMVFTWTRTLEILPASGEYLFAFVMRFDGFYIGWEDFTIMARRIRNKGLGVFVN